MVLTWEVKDNSLDRFEAQRLAWFIDEVESCFKKQKRSFTTANQLLDKVSKRNLYSLIFNLYENNPQGFASSLMEISEDFIIGQPYDANTLVICMITRASNHVSNKPINRKSDMTLEQLIDNITEIM